jgi:hypothetical protein
MRKLIILSITTIGVLGSVYNSIAFIPNEIQDENGFVALFNGRNLDGWVNVNGAPETYFVRDNMIVTSGIPNGMLRTEKQYQNYILELEWRHTKEKGNAGLFIHSDDLPPVGRPFTRAVEIQIMDGNGGDIFPIQGATMTPWKLHPWGRSLPIENRNNPSGQWNHYRVESRDGTVILTVNGKVVNWGYHANPRKGYICLEAEGSEAHFRNIRLKELPGEMPNPAVTAKTARSFRQLYNGNDLREWKLAPGSEGHWSPEGWILNYDGQSEAESRDDKDLWTKDEFRNFCLIVDWRQTKKPTVEEVPVILPDGSYSLNENGEQLTVPVNDAGDSGIYIRGDSKCQFNIWNWPVGSGEIYGYRTDENMPPSVRKGATPILNADRIPGEWNRFEITVIDDWVTCVLNGKTVINEVRLPGMPEKGPIGLQHHGDSIQFANIYIKELP